MKIIDINVTAEDLEGNGWDTQDCPGFRAVRRKVPSLTSWGFGGGYCDAEILISAIGGDIREKLAKHANWQRPITLPGKKAEPFTFQVTVPDNIMTKD